MTSFDADHESNDTTSNTAGCKQPVLHIIIRKGSPAWDCYHLYGVYNARIMEEKFPGPK